LLACCLLPPWPWQTRAPALAVCAALLAACVAWPPGGRPLAQLLALESGNGLAIIVRTRAHAVVVDTGDAWRSHGSAAAQRLVPALRALGVGAVDLLVLGRATADRGAGIAQLTKAMPVRELVAPPGWQASPLALTPCANRRWQWDSASFELHLAGGSCALHVQVAGQGWWIVHTARPDDELALAQVLGVASSRLPQRAQVLVLRRGAVRAGSSHPLWRLLEPQSVIAAGRGTGQQPLSAARVWRTGDHGALRLVVSAGGAAAWSSERGDSAHWPWRRPGAEAIQ
jgi:competence protein ComEC